MQSFSLLLSCCVFAWTVPKTGGALLFCAAIVSVFFCCAWELRRRLCLQFCSLQFVGSARLILLRVECSPSLCCCLVVCLLGLFQRPVVLCCSVLRLSLCFFVVRGSCEGGFVY